MAGAPRLRPLGRDCKYYGDPPTAFRVLKVKSQQDASVALTSEDAWKIRGNDKADSLAKAHLQDEVRNKPTLQQRTQRYSRYIEDATLCSSMLQEISQFVFSDEENQKKHKLRANSEEDNGDPLMLFSPRVIDSSLISRNHLGFLVAGLGSALFFTD